MASSGLHPSGPPDRGITWRAIGIGVLLLPLNAFWLVQMEMATNQPASTGGSSGPYPTTFSLFANVICFLVALCALNGLVRRFWPAKALSQGELLVIYVMLAIGTCLASVDFLDVLIPMLGHPVHRADAANRWTETLLPHLPRWFYVTDKRALEGWYTGSTNPYTWERLRAWAVPLGAWGGFILVLLGVMLSINVLVRRQWTQSEKLSYPIIQMPLDMTDHGTPFFRHRLMWTGFAVAGAVSLMNGLAVLHPGVPSVQVKMLDVSPYFPNKPWNAVGWTPISFYPFAIGLGFLLPADLLFSSWVFYFGWKAERVVSSIFGWSDVTPTFPYVNEQSFGAYMGIAAIALWGVRRHIAAAARQALGLRRTGEPAPGPRSRGETRTYRLALAGAVCGTALLVGFFWVSGLALWTCLAAVAIYLAIAFAVTRMRAELGPPAHDLHNGGPDYILTAALGSRFFGAQQLTILTYFYWFNRAYRSLAMPVQLEAFKMAERKDLSYRRMAAALVIAAVVGLLCGYWALYHFGYRNGVEAQMAPHLSYFGREAFDRLTTWTASPRDTDVPAVIAIGVGLLATLTLQALRLRFSWWPLHPLGLAVSGSWSMNTIWVPMLIAWLCKVSVLRYGGLRSYRQALYFFLGLILGDYVLGCAWPIVGWLLGCNAYSFQQ